MCIPISKHSTLAVHAFMNFEHSKQKTKYDIRFLIREIVTKHPSLLKTVNHFLNVHKAELHKECAQGTVHGVYYIEYVSITIGRCAA